MTKVLIVDDHAVVREGLAHALKSANYEVVAMAATVAEAIAQIARTNPDIVVVDLSLPDGSGFEVVLWIRSISKKIGVVILTLNSGPEFLHAAIKAGANGFVLKSAPLPQLIAAIDHCIASPKSFTAEGLNTLHHPATNQLTAREFDVLTKMAMGLSNQAIAAELFLSQSTVKSHISAIFRKLAVANRVSAINYARQKGLLVK